MTPETVAYLREHRTDSAEAISAVLQADPRFARPRIPADDLRGLFSGTLVGVKLHAAAANDQLPAELRAGIQRVLMTVAWETGYLDTWDLQHAAELRAGVEALTAVGVLTAEERDQFLSLGGGTYYTPLSPVEVQAELDRMDREDAIQALTRAWADLHNTVMAYLSALAGTDEPLPTLAELRQMGA